MENFDLKKYIAQIKSKPKKERTKEEKDNLQFFMNGAIEEEDVEKRENRTRLEEQAKPLIAQRNALRKLLSDSENSEQVKQMKANAKILSDLNKKHKKFKDESDACKSYLDTTKKLKIVGSTLKKLQSEMKKMGGKLVIHRTKKKTPSSTPSKNKKRSRDEEDPEDPVDESDAEKRTCV